MTTRDEDIANTVALLRAASAERFVKALASLDQRADVAEVQEIKNQLRDRLAELRPARRLNITRLFCDPFEDMLRNEVEEQSSWIPRAAIQPCWTIVEARIAPKLLTEIKSKLESLTPADHDRIYELSTRLWDAVSTALAKATAAARDGDEASLKLFDGDMVLVGHVEVMAAACQVAPALQGLKKLFPKRPLKTLSLADREELLAVLTRLAAEHKHDLRCVVHVLAHWTGNPAEVFELCAPLDLGLASPLGKILAAQREKMVVGLVGEQVKELQTKLDGEEMSITDCVELARVAADSIGSAIDLIKDHGVPGADSGVARLKSELGGMIKDRVIGAASQALGSVWSKKRRAGDEVADRDSIVAAESAARAMHKCGKLASKLGIESAVTKKITASLDAVRSEVSEKIAAVSKDPEEGNMVAVRSTLANATRILEILEGPDRAFEFFREKRNALRPHA